MPNIHIDLNEFDLRNAAMLDAFAALFTTLRQHAPGGLKEQPKTCSGVINPDDNPEKGIPTPAEVFRSLETVGTEPQASIPSPAQAFGGSAPLAQAPQPGAQPSLPATTITAPPGGLVQPPAAPTQPIPVPPPAVAPAPAGSTNPAPAGVELDTEGLPWDVRIHSGSKEKIANGTWKLKRGVAQQEVWLNQIKDELRRALGNAPAAAAPQPNPAWPFPIPGQTTSPTPLPPATAAPVASDTGTITMAQLLPRFTAAMSSNPPALTPDVACAICTEISAGAVTNVAMLAVRPDLVPLVWARLDQMGVPK